MNIILWVIASIVMLAITYYVHKHTYDGYDRDYINGVYVYHRFTIPRWVAFAFVILLLCPVGNIIFFILGAIIYLTNISTNDIKFIPKGNSCISKIFNYLNKEI